MFAEIFDFRIYTIFQFLKIPVSVRAALHSFMAHWGT